MARSRSHGGRLEAERSSQARPGSRHAGRLRTAGGSATVRHRGLEGHGKTPARRRATTPAPRKRHLGCAVVRHGAHPTGRAGVARITPAPVRRNTVRRTRGPDPSAGRQRLREHLVRKASAIPGRRARAGTRVRGRTEDVRRRTNRTRQQIGEVRRGRRRDLEHCGAQQTSQGREDRACHEAANSPPPITAGAIRSARGRWRRERPRSPRASACWPFHRRRSPSLPYGASRARKIVVGQRRSRRAGSPPCPRRE
jgi:hypothetical protein